MKLRLLCLLSALTLCVAVLCACTQEDKTSQENAKYKLVEPTQEDFDNIQYQLGAIMISNYENYDCTKDNIYTRLFMYNHLRNVDIRGDEDIEKYIAPPFYKEENFSLWYTTVNENDPLGKFGKIPEEAYDSQGNFNEDLAYEVIDREGWKNVVVGYNKFSGEYIDFLVEGVWNGKIDHETLFEFEDDSLCYYYDGFYYTPEWGGDRGDIGPWEEKVDEITPLGDNKFEVDYTVYDYSDYSVFFTAKAVVGLKETKDGFRFWSIYELEQDK